jgi:small subunit ribosomal protein S6
VIRPYETAVVFDGTLSDDAINKEQAALEEFFRANSEFEKADVWGKRALAYTINKKKIGYYVIFFYRADGGVPAAFEKHIKLNESILRYLTVVRDLKNEAAREAWAVRREKGEEIVKPDDQEDEDIDREVGDERY